LGIIQKQSVKGSIIGYAGVLIGFVTTGILQPKLLEIEEIGVLALLLSWSLIFATIATLGINAVSNRLFPYFRNSANKHNGYLFIVVITSITGFIVAMIIFWVLKPFIIKESLKETSIFIEYIYYIIPLTFFTLLFLVLDIYYAVIYNAVKGLFIKEFLQRVFLLLAILFLAFNIFDFGQFLIAWMIAISLPGIILLINLVKDGEFSLRPNISYLSKSLKKSMISVGFFGIIVAFSNIIVQTVDRIMIDNIINLGTTGIYHICAFFGVLVVIPSRTIINKISTVIIADAWKENDIKTINKIYSSTTINQLILGLLVFIGIWANINNVFTILPEYVEGKYVIFFIALANLFTMISGVSGPILTTSKYFRTLTYFIIIFGALVLITNLIFIKIYGLTGAALASVISVFIYCSLRYLFLYFKYKMQPYNYKHLIIIVIGIVVYVLNLLIPTIENSNHPTLFMIIDIFVRSSLIVLVFGFFIIKTKVSPELNENFSGYIKKLKTIFKKA